ncbi:MAPEG family protein [Bradyrhizobium oligotrophicum]|uniref:MAPEG family protein n=1 Tax=Bradyrhizobium oligotrophicum TaxID=44255 RepID=UPI003EB9D0EB
MTIAEWCIFASVMLYLLTIVPAKWIKVDGAGRYDNARPRDPAFYAGGIRERALGAHQNGIEAFPFFAVAVLLAEFRGAPQNLINELSVLFVIVRVAYVLTYIGDRPSLRSILWAIGFLITVAIFFLPLLRNYLPV